MLLSFSSYATAPGNERLESSAASVQEKIKDD